MSIKIAAVTVLGFGFVLSGAQPPIEGERLRAHVKFLASDLLEGRGVGTRGGQIAEEYIVAILASFGVRPAGENGTYFQRVPMTGVLTSSESKLEATGSGKTTGFVWQQDWVGTSQRQKPEESIDAELVFVGHGILAPEEKWDDFKGTDVKGKVLVLFTNEPQPDNPQVFKGKTLTYKGRWTYKFEEAARQGAAGALIIHTTPTAGYGWEVVRNSWSKEDPQMRLAPGEYALGLAGWLTQDAGERLLQMSGHSVPEFLKAADSRDFRPIPLGIRLRAALHSKMRPIESRNVIGIVPGETDDAVAYTAHWDHLGRGVPVDGDDIYNGAVDNATGCAVVLETARVWASLDKKPRRSALFLFVTAEESGLRGSEYYGQHPLLATGKIALNINYDALYPVGRSKDVIVLGAERTTAWPLVQEAAERYQLTIQPDPHPEQGSYYRSDHFSLARVGIPAFSVKMPGDEYFREYNAKHYHQPSDEYRDDWNFTGMEHIARFGFLLGLNAANSEQMFSWNPGDEFLSAREQSFSSHTSGAK